MMNTKMFSNIFESVSEHLPSSSPLLLDRKDLPQFSAEELEGFVQFLRGKGIKVDNPEWINVGLIKFVQKKIDPDKIDDCMQADGDEERVFLLDRSYQLVDGHHAIFSRKLKGDDLWARCYVADIDLGDIITWANEYL